MSKNKRVLLFFYWSVWHCTLFFCLSLFPFPVMLKDVSDHWMFVLVCNLWHIAVHNTHAGIRINFHHANCKWPCRSLSFPIWEKDREREKEEEKECEYGNCARRNAFDMPYGMDIVHGIFAKYDNCICFELNGFSAELLQCKYSVRFVHFYWSISIGFNSNALQGS